MLQGSEQSTFLGRAANVLHLADPLESTLVDVPFILSHSLLRQGLVFIVRNNETSDWKPVTMASLFQMWTQMKSTVPGIWCGWCLNVGSSKAHAELQKLATSRMNTWSWNAGCECHFYGQTQNQWIHFLWLQLKLPGTWNWGSSGLQIIPLHYHDSEPELISCAEQARVSAPVFRAPWSSRKRYVSFGKSWIRLLW